MGRRGQKNEAIQGSGGKRIEARRKTQDVGSTQEGQYEIQFTFKATTDEAVSFMHVADESSTNGLPLSLFHIT